MRVALALLLPACIGSVAPAQCAVDSDCGAGGVCVGALCHPGSRELDGGTCPLVQARWAEIDQHLIQVGCGVRSTNCHSSGGAVQSSALDLSGDPYARLVNGGSADGGFVLVKPGDPDHSFLYVKLHQTRSFDPQTGSGMPPDHPGETCAQAQEAVRQWIVAGAERN